MFYLITNSAFLPVTVRARLLKPHISTPVVWLTIIASITAEIAAVNDYVDVSNCRNKFGAK